jgi:hypothetical protein
VILRLRAQRDEARVVMAEEGEVGRGRGGHASAIMASRQGTPKGLSAPTQCRKSTRDF